MQKKGENNSNFVDTLISKLMALLPRYVKLLRLSLLRSAVITVLPNYNLQLRLLSYQNAPAACAAWDK